MLMLGLVCAVCVVLGGGLSAQVPAPPALSIDEAIREALDRNLGKPDPHFFLAGLTRADTKAR